MIIAIPEAMERRETTKSWLSAPSMPANSQDKIPT
jgi:hypothetical protein